MIGEGRLETGVAQLRTEIGCCPYLSHVPQHSVHFLILYFFVHTLLTLIVNHVLKFKYQCAHLNINIQLRMYMHGV
jgi:hypothetical protein